MGLITLGAIGIFGQNNGAAVFWLLIVAAFLAVPVVRHHKMTKYFASEEFQAQKAALVDVVREHNDRQLC